jgi:hypothetical protein
MIMRGWGRRPLPVRPRAQPQQPRSLADVYSQTLSLVRGLSQNHHKPASQLFSGISRLAGLLDLQLGHVRGGWVMYGAGGEMRQAQEGVWELRESRSWARETQVSWVPEGARQHCTHMFSQDPCAEGMQALIGCVVQSISLPIMC